MGCQPVSILISDGQERFPPTNSAVHSKSRCGAGPEAQGVRGTEGQQRWILRPKKGWGVSAIASEPRFAAARMEVSLEGPKKKPRNDGLGMDPPADGGMLVSGGHRFQISGPEGKARARTGPSHLGENPYAVHMERMPPRRRGAMAWERPSGGWCRRVGQAGGCVWSPISWGCLRIPRIRSQ